MASQVEIVNVALTLLGMLEEIISIDDNSTTARTAKKYWNTARRKILEESRWNFAIQRTQLPALSASPIYGYSYQFQLPTDYIKLIEIDGEPAYTIEGTKILCNSAPIKIRYIFDNTDIAQWSPTFVTCFAHYLAYLMAYPLTKKQTLAQQAFESFVQEFERASSSDSQISEDDYYQDEGLWSELVRS